MKQIKIITAMFVVLVIMSFKDKAASEKVKTGIYGVCDCGEINSSKVELTINEDFTFHYYSNANPANVIDIKGNWSLDGSTVLLKDYMHDASIHNKWTIDKNQKCLKSRKGLEWIRLCHLKSCS